MATFESGLARHADLAEALDAYAREWPPGACRRYFQGLAKAIQESAERSKGELPPQRWQPLWSVATQLTGDATPAAALQSVIHLAHNDLDQRSAVWRGLRYPMALVCLTGFVLVVFQIAIAPSIIATFPSFGTDSPRLTRALLTVGANLPIVLLVMVVLGALGGFLLARYEPQWIIDRIPVVGKLLRATSRSSFLQGMAGLLAAGIPPTDAVALAGAVNRRRGIRRAATQWQAWHANDSADAVRPPRPDEFPAVVDMALRSDRPAREKAQFLSMLAGCQHQRAGEAWRDLATFSEPVAIILVGIVILIYIVAVFLPLIQSVTIFL